MIKSNFNEKNKINFILIVCHYAQQPPYNTMLRYHNWGKQLVKRGYKVVIVAASTVHNTDIDIIDLLGSSESICDGINYLYVKTPKYRGNRTQRIWNMMSFCLGLSKKTKILPKADVVITCEAYTFPFVKLFFQHRPIITDTVDLWPASIIEYANFSKRNPIVTILYALEKMAYLKSDALIFSIEGGEQYLREQKYSKKIDYRKVYNINMGCDMEEFDKNIVQYKDLLPWDMNKFNIVYCGSVRHANQVRQICDAGKELVNRGIDDIAIHIYGNGSDQKKLEKYVNDNGIENVKFYGRIEKAKIPYILSSAKINIFTYKQVSLMKYGGSQSKLFDYLASGRPIICNMKMRYNLVAKFNCGLITENQSAKAFADTIQEFYGFKKEQLEEMGYNSRRVAEAYDQPGLVDRLCEVFDFIKSNEKGTKLL